MTGLLKIARASAVGSAACVAIALVIMPKFWLFGLVAGLAGGYIVGYFGYEFKQTMAAVPKAFLSLCDIGLRFGMRCRAAADFLYREQAHIVLGLAVGLALSPFAIEAVRDTPYESFSNFDWVGFFLVLLTVCAIGIGFFMVMNIIGTEKQGKSELVEKRYLAALYDTLIGVKWTILFFAFYLWKGLLVGGWAVVREIHSAQRIACGVDSVVGGFLTIYIYQTWGPATPTTTDYLVAVLTGALVGGVVGIVASTLARKSDTASA